MAEAAAAINLGASALAFIELGYRIGVRLKDFLDASQDAPKAFKDIADRLPLLATKIGDIKTAHDIGNIDPARANALSKVVKGCERQVAELDTLLETLLPSQNNEESSAMITRLRVMSKAVRSVFKEKEVQRIQQTLQAYESTLTFYFSDISLGHAQQRQLGTGEKVTRYYVIPVLSVPKFVARKQQMNAIQEILSSSPTSNGIVRDQRKVAVILGMGGMSFYDFIFISLLLMVWWQRARENTARAGILPYC